MKELSPNEIKEQKLYRDWGLSEQEYQQIQTTLNRLPNFTETGLYAAMWSEHCSYKSSKPLLKQFPTKGKRILQGPGEGAGIIDIGDNQAVVFKAESHNHPTAVEPYQGAATGVGGIVRDIFSMGARPIASLNSLHFGELDNEKTKFLLDKTVAGIGDYGNCMGIPTVGGELTFDDAFKENPVMNAMCVGLLDIKDSQIGAAAGVGNLIYYVGAKTGRDGIQGAIFASAEFSDEKQTQRSAVQVGDPFAEKQLMEACLDLIKNHADILVGIQDMGAAGLVSSSAEMAAKADYGMELNLDLVPQRESGMIPYELMLSESQERMLLCVRKGSGKLVEELFNRYESEAVQIGEVTEDKSYKLFQNNKLVAEVPVHSLVDEAPVYTYPSKRPSRLEDKSSFVPEITDLNETMKQMLAQPTIASKSSIFERYDSMVQTNTIVAPGSDAAVIRVRGTKKALAITTDANPRYIYLNPYLGGQIAVSEAARNIVAAGGTPIGITDCLNFGKPEDPEVYYELQNATKGMAEACKIFDTPVISGNVSLYNESNQKAIYPTPMVGMVGLIEDQKQITTLKYKNAGDLIYLLGKTESDFNGTEIQKLQEGVISGSLDNFDLEYEKQIQDLVSQSIKSDLVNSVHDLAEGGLGIGLVEGAFASNLGIDVQVEFPATHLFSETQSRFVITIDQEKQAEFEQLIGKFGNLIGQVIEAPELKIQTQDLSLDLDLIEAKNIWKDALSWQMK